MTRKRIKGIAISYFGKAQKKHFWVARGKKGETSMELLDTPEAIFGAGIELGYHFRHGSIAGQHGTVPPRSVADV
jgi:hypothetical protein